MLSLAEQDWILAAGNGDVIGFFAELGIDLRGTDEATVRCFANPDAHERGDRNPSCSVSLETGKWNCFGCGSKGNAYQAAQRLGCDDKRAALLAKRYGLFLEVVKEKPSLPTEPRLRKWRHALRDDPRLVRRLVELKGWDAYTIGRLGLGWDGERVTFVIRSGRENEKCGVIRWSPRLQPKVVAVPGTKRNLWPNPDLIHRRHPILVVEGEGTAVSCWSAGFKAVGVPGASSWRKEWAPRFYGRRVIVLSDCDAPGRTLASRIAADVPNVQIVDIEPGRSDGYDVGDMIAEASREGGVNQVRRCLERLIA